MADATPLQGRKALVMGADKAIAAAIALALARAGADVAVTSTTGDPEEAFSLRGLRRRIEATGRQAIADIADLGNGSSVQIAVRQIAKQLGDIDLLVIAPQDALLKPIERLTDSEWSRVLAFNLNAYFYACRATAREMLTHEATPRGRIIALLPGIEAADGASALLAARGGAEALIAALAREWATRGVLVNAIALSASGEPSAERSAVEAALRLATSDAPGQIVRLD